MRASIVRMATWFATALVAASTADAATEFAENLGWLGGTARDGHQETVLPVLSIGVGVALAVSAYAACARISGRDLSQLRSGGIRTQMLGAACALIGSLLCTIAMEGFETRFGGFAPFDAQSVIVSHAPALLAAFAVVTVVIQGAMRELLYAAERAGERVARSFMRFVRKLLNAGENPVVSHACAIAACISRCMDPVEGAGRALRAPPRCATLRPTIA